MVERKTWVEITLIFVGIFIIGGIIFGYRHYAKSSESVNRHNYSPSDSASKDSLSADKVNTTRLKTQPSSNSVAPQVDTSDLDNQINAIISSNSDMLIGVSIEDVSTGSVYNYGSLGAMTAASITKVLTAVDYLNQVEQGNASLDDVMVDGNTAQYDMEQMIVVSDNNAWQVLNEDLGYTQMQAYAESIGLDTYYYGDNTISVSDTTKLLGDLYTRQLINEADTQLLLSYMERANYRGLIIPAVPDYDTVYHKVGFLDSYMHDAAIITNSNKAIVLSIFTQSLYSLDQNRVASIMQQITTPTLQTFQLN